MKRSEALQPLSRDHHQALSLAQRLRRAEDAGQARKSFLEFWDRHGAEHFRIEEEVLLPRWAQLGRADPEAVARIANEHLEIRVAALRLEAGEAELDSLHRLGKLLDDHVRYEERRLFPAIEADLGAAGLRELAAAVEASAGR